MAKVYEINGSVFIDPKKTIGNCFILNNSGEKDLTEKVRYKTLDTAMQIKNASNLSQFTAITIYEWSGNSISNVFFIK
jgi:hypothetical protein